MITAWRIVKAAHASNAFNGDGARLLGGRWNAPGTAMVYTSASSSLAVLEMLVHIGRASILASYVLISCRFSEGLVERLDRSLLPHDWRTFPAPAALQRIGDTWAEGQRSAVLEVPSAIVDAESNYLLNPAHRDFRKIAIGKAEKFAFDARLTSNF